MQNYEFLKKRIASFSGLSEDEIEKRIEAKRAKLSGLISREGAAQIIAAELGINLENIELKVAEISHGLKKINLLVKVVKIFPVRAFNKNGKEGKVSNLIVADESGSVKVVLWDTNQIKLIEEGIIKEGDCVEIKNASVRDSEVHLSGFSDIKKTNLELGEVKIGLSFQKKFLNEVKSGDSVIIKGVVVQVFSPRFFYVCPECKKRVVENAEGYSCVEHGNILPTERAILTLVVDDGTDNIRVIAFSDQIAKLVEQDKLKNGEEFLKLKEKILGEEFLFFGFIRKNPLFGENELVLSDLKEIVVEELLSEIR